MLNGRAHRTTVRSVLFRTSPLKGCLASGKQQEPVHLFEVHPRDRGTNRCLWKRGRTLAGLTFPGVDSNGAGFGSRVVPIRWLKHDERYVIDSYTSGTTRLSTFL